MNKQIDEIDIKATAEWLGPTTTTAAATRFPNAKVSQLKTKTE